MADAINAVGEKIGGMTNWYVVSSQRGSQMSCYIPLPSAEYMGKTGRPPCYCGPGLCLGG